MLSKVRKTNVSLSLQGPIAIEYAEACKVVPMLRTYFPDNEDAKRCIVSLKYFWNVLNTLNPVYVR